MRQIFWMAKLIHVLQVSDRDVLVMFHLLLDDLGNPPFFISNWILPAPGSQNRWREKNAGIVR